MEKGPPRSRLLPVPSPEMSNLNFWDEIHHPKCPHDRKFSTVLLLLMHKKKDGLKAILNTLPREYVEDVYLSVRLEAGTLHLANYLIRATV